MTDNRQFIRCSACPSLSLFVCCSHTHTLTHSTPQQTPTPRPTPALTCSKKSRATAVAAHRLKLRTAGIGVSAPSPNANTCWLFTGNTFIEQRHTDAAGSKLCVLAKGALCERKGKLNADSRVGRNACCFNSATAVAVQTVSPLTSQQAAMVIEGPAEPSARPARATRGSEGSCL